MDERKYKCIDITNITGLDRYTINLYKDIVKPRDYYGHSVQKKKDSTDYERYALFDENGLTNFRQIALLGRLGLKPKQIKEILNEKNEVDNKKIYDEIIERSEAKIKELQDIVILATNLKEIETPTPLLYELLGETTLAEFADNIKKFSKEEMEKIQQASEKLPLDISNKLIDILKKAGEIFVKDIDSEKFEEKIENNIKCWIKTYGTIYHSDQPKYSLLGAITTLSDAERINTVSQLFSSKEDAKEYFEQVCVSIYVDYRNSILKVIEDYADIEDDDSYFMEYVIPQMVSIGKQYSFADEKTIIDIDLKEIINEICPNTNISDWIVKQLDLYVDGNIRGGE